MSRSRTVGADDGISTVPFPACIVGIVRGSVDGAG